METTASLRRHARRPRLADLFRRLLPRSIIPVLCAIGIAPTRDEVEPESTDIVPRRSATLCSQTATRRDPVNNYLSIFKNFFAAEHLRYACDLSEIGHYYARALSRPYGPLA